MRIAHVLTRLLRAGSEENTIATCLDQVRRGHVVFLIHGRDYIPSYYKELKPAHIELIKIDSLVHEIDLPHDFRACFQLVDVFNKLHLDVVHTHQSKAGIIGRAAARLAGVPTLVHGVHIPPFVNASRAASLIYVAAERFCGSFTDLFIHVGRQMQDEYLRRGIGRRADHIVAESGMELYQFRHASPPADANKLLASPIGRLDKPFVVLFLGALEKRKAHRRFLLAFQHVVSERPNTVLLVAGEGEEKGAIEHDVAELKLNAHVRMLGFRNDPQSLLAISDALVICSEREGFPRVAVQAGLSGVPIISTPLPGIEKIVRNNETGLVGPLQDFDKMLRRLIDEPEIRRSMSNKLLALDYEPWDVNTMTAKIELAYLAHTDGMSNLREGQ